MELRSAVASAAVSRRSGRRRNRFGAFSLVLARLDHRPRILGRMRPNLAFVCLIIFADAILYGVITPLVPGYVDDYHLSTFRAGLLVGAFGAGVLAGAIPTGVLAGRFGALGTARRTRYTT